MSFTVSDFIAERFASLGVTTCFGVPGDYSFPLNDAISCHKTLRWINSTNELNAGYAADGYARKKGIGLMCTTYGVGELSGLNAFAGGCAEGVVLFHLVGMPDGITKESGVHAHHSLGSFASFFRISKTLSPSAIILTKENYKEELEGVIMSALKEHKPGYIGVPYSVAVMAIEGLSPGMVSVPTPTSPEENKTTILSIIANKINSSKTIAILPSVMLRRYGVSDVVQNFSLTHNIPFFTLPIHKGAIPETTETFMGCCFPDGAGSSLRDFIRNVDVVVEIGDVIYTDLFFGGLPLPFDTSKVIRLGFNEISIDSKVASIEDLSEVVKGLSKVIKVFDFVFPKESLERKKHVESGINSNLGEYMTYGTMARILEEHIPPKTTVISDVGSFLEALIRMRLNDTNEFLCQGHYASIGWSVPATLGVCLSGVSSEETILTVVGDGAFQLTMNDVASYAKYHIKPIIIIVKNGGYMIERRIHKVSSPGSDFNYNDIQDIDYISLFKSMGCSDWYAVDVSTYGEFTDSVLNALSRGGSVGSLIVLNMKKY